MAVGAQSPVQAVPAISLGDPSATGSNDPVLIFTVPGNAPARIESVRLRAAYGAADISDWWVLRIYDISGLQLASFVAGPVLFE